MLLAILTIGPPVILIVGMFGVGLSMTRPVVLDVVARPGPLLALTCIQWLALPAVGMLLILTIDPPQTVALAILLIAACPGGGISNLYVLFARANTSLSVLMTLTSLAAASLTLPAALAVMRWSGFESVATNVSPAGLSLRLIGIIVVPVAVGMLVRIYAPGFASRWEERLRMAAALMILMILAAILWLEREAVLLLLPQMAFATAVFLGLAVALGLVFGRLFYTDDDSRFAVMTEFGVRNLAIGTFVAVSLEGNLAFAGPAAVYLLLESVLLIALGLVRRRKPGHATKGAMPGGG